MHRFEQNGTHSLDIAGRLTLREHAAEAIDFDGHRYGVRIRFKVSESIRWLQEVTIILAQRQRGVVGR
jgi:hypothetical protein